MILKGYRNASLSCYTLYLIALLDALYQFAKVLRESLRLKIPFLRRYFFQPRFFATIEKNDGRPVIPTHFGDHIHESFFVFLTHIFIQQSSSRYIEE